MRWLVSAMLISLLASVPPPAQNAPGAPGARSVWAPAAKDFVGTAATSASRVVFTGAQGVLTEVFYPTPDTAQNVDLQFLVTDVAKTWGDEDRRQRRGRGHAVGRGQRG